MESNNKRGPARKWMRSALKSEFLVHLDRSGFEPMPLSGEDAKSREIVAAFPFGRHRRTNSSGFDVVEVQLDKGGRAAFRINFGKVPAEGLSISDSRILAVDVWTHYLPTHYALYRFPRFGIWFSVIRWPWTKVDEQDYLALTRWVITLWPEVERVLSSGVTGPHVAITELSTSE